MQTIVFEKTQPISYPKTPIRRQSMVSRAQFRRLSVEPVSVSPIILTPSSSSLSGGASCGKAVSPPTTPPVLQTPGWSPQTSQPGTPVFCVRTCDKKAFITPVANNFVCHAKRIAPPSLQKAPPQRLWCSSPFTTPIAPPSTKKRKKRLQTFLSPEKKRRTISEMSNSCEFRLPYQSVPSTPGHSRFHSDFEEIEMVGSGSFADVWRARHRLDGTYYAVKISRKTFSGEATRELLLKEARQLAYVSSGDYEPHLVRYFSSWIEGARLAIQTELCKFSLADMLKEKSVSFAEVFQLIAHVATGLEFLHSKQTAHLDIKPENILVSDHTSIYKIADFGMATMIKGEDLDFSEGDCRYLAAELLKSDNEGPKDLTKADIFSLGAMVYEILVGRPLPLNGAEWHRIREGKIRKDDIFANAQARLSMDMPRDVAMNLEGVCGLVEAMLHPDARIRPAARMVIRHPLIIPYVTRAEIQCERAQALDAKLRELQ
eukprot:Platyproteum_vivax@DN16471_c0_g1_i1.p1